MLKVDILIENNNVIEVNMKGHADYKEYGKDIVCSAASSIMITSVNAILMFSDDYVKYSEQDGETIITILEHNETTDKLITNMISLLEELENDYPNNIKIRRKK